MQSTWPRAALDCRISGGAVPTPGPSRATGEHGWLPQHKDLLFKFLFILLYKGAKLLGFLIEPVFQTWNFDPLLGSATYSTRYCGRASAGHWLSGGKPDTVCSMAQHGCLCGSAEVCGKCSGFNAEGRFGLP